MVVNFPVTDVNDPNYSHTHTEPSGVTWTWDGEKWRVTNNSSDGGGGAPSDINLQEVTDNGAITDNIVDFQSGAIVSGGQLQLPGGGNDTDALQRQEVVSLINSNQTVTDGRYLRLDVDAAAQSVESTAGVSYKGLTQHEAGVNVTGGDFASVNNGLVYGGGSRRLWLVDNDVNVLGVKGNDAGNAIAISSNVQLKTISSSNSSVYQADYFGVGHEGEVSNFLGVYSSPDLLADGGKANCFKANANTTLTADNVTLAGFRNSITSGQVSGANSQTFAFLNTWETPSFHKGNYYIGGDIARNTRELWEFTLTEEQQEQLTAGTLAIPANVSTPGNGEFVRQWWYDQQSAEDQALIDAGELEYPSHFQAANFTDTFALGDKTNINLESTGGAVFQDSVFIKNNLCVNVGRSAAKSRLHVRHGFQSVLRGMNTNQYGSSNLDLLGGRNSSPVGSGFTSDVGALNFYNHRGYSGASDRDDNAKKIAGVHAYAQSSDVKNSAAGILSFAVSPAGIDPATGEVYTPKDFLSINQSGSVLVSDWYDTTKFALVVNTQTDTDAVILKTNTKETISFESAIGLGQTAGDKRNVVEFKVPNNSNGQATQSILIGSKRLFDGNTAAQAHTFIQGKTGKLVFDHGSSGTTRFFGIDSSSGTEVENLAYTISKDGSMKIENMTTFNLQMESDDPAAFQTTYSTDEEGNQVENQTYIGTTEDLLSIIKDLRARVAALEGA